MMRDVMGGELKVKGKTVTYLPRLTEQSDEEYKAYLFRAYFFNATARVKDALLGMVFRRDMSVEIPAAIENLTDDITLSGVSLQDFAQQVTSEMLELTHGGILVDFPAVDLTGRQLTLVEATVANLRPFMRFYRAESIINWRVRSVNGRQELDLVVLEECESRQDPDDEFAEENVLRYRVLDLVEGKYRQRVYESQVNEKTKATSLVKVSESYPVMNGNAMWSIPFFLVGNPNSLEKVQQPLLYDLARINLAHYRNSADMEHGLHFTGLPTPVVSGVSNTDAVFRIGSGTAWVLGDPQAKASYLEFSGQGLGALRTAIQDKEAMMAALGARILAPEKKAAETAESMGLRRQGEISVLAALANHVSRQLTRALEIVRDWAGATGEVRVQLNTDYSVSRLDAASISALLQSVMGGQISPETFYDTLVDGEAIKTSRTFAEERDLIAETNPPPANDNTSAPDVAA